MKSKVISLFFFLIILNSNLKAQNFVYAKQMGGADDDEGFSITVDNSGNVISTGCFQGNADFNPSSSTFNLTTNGDYDVFVSKLDAQGNFIWAKKLGGSLNDYGYSITTDESGNIYLTGVFEGTADFDPGNGVFNLTSSGLNDIFICKLNSDGNFIWAKKMGGIENDASYSITIDNSDNVITTGYFLGTADFNPGAAVFNLTSAGNFDVFISKLDGDGNFIWAKRIGGSNVDYGDIAYDLITDTQGNIIITGAFSGTADFDPNAGVANLTSFGLYDIFICKLSPLGNFIWAKQMGGQFDDLSYSIARDNQGNYITTGVFAGSADFNPSNANFNLTAEGEYDIFVSKLDENGNFIWAKRLGGGAYDYGKDVTIDNQSNILLTGYFSGFGDFNPSNSEEFNLFSTGNEDIFVTKLNSAGNFVWAKQMGGLSFDQGKAITLDQQGNAITTGVFQGISDFDPNENTFNNLTSFGSYDIFVSKIGCVNTSSNINVSTCNNYTLNGQTYTTSGTYIQNLINSAGCDSIITLNLVIYPNYSQILDITACDSYSFNSQNYTASGTYVQQLSTVNGCDSTITLNLTIKNSSSLTLNETACGSYTFNLITNEIIYTSSGTYTHTFTNAAGCDSTVTLNLTINNADNSVTNNGNTLISNASDAQYQWIDCNFNLEPIAGEINQTFSPANSGSYAVIVNQFGCSDTSDCQNITITQIKNNFNKNDFIIYPNPFTLQAIVYTQHLLLNANISVFNYLGQKVDVNYMITGNSILINRNNLNNGIYYLQIDQNNKILLNEKLIVTD